MVWEAITGLNINGGGRLAHQGEPAVFGFTARYMSGSVTPAGRFQYIGARGQTIRSEGFDWLVATTDNLALLEGMASIDGGSGHSFRLTVLDAATPGQDADTFELKIDGLTVVEGTISAGDIRVNR